MNFPVITIDYSFFQNLGDLPPWVVMWRLFLVGGWLPFLIVSASGFWKMWVNWRQNLYAAKLKFVLLAIDVPKETEQTPKAVENMFAHISGTFKGMNVWEKYWIGEFVLPFSFEIVSIDGYLQFLIRTVAKHRNLVEAVIYAQYPDAEITEVEDYVTKIPTRYPDKEYEMFGTEFVLAKKSLFPIRSYMDFEDKITGEFKDPLSSVLEVMTKLRPGEQMGIQIIAIPAADAWKDAGEKEAKKLAGHTIPPKKSAFSGLIDAPVSIIKGVLGEILPAGGGSEKKQELFPRAMMLTAGERDTIAAIQAKASKPGFLIKFRIVYLAKHNVFTKGPVYTVSGSLKQFAALNLNSFKMFGKMSPKFDYWYQRMVRRSKQRKLALAYKFRSPVKGAPLFILNTEEIATIYHFPSMYMKTPLLKKTEVKKAEPPMGIPIHEEVYVADEESDKVKTDLGPDNLPVI